jgi:Fe2+ or Zn2+ uptake regulation protein
MENGSLKYYREKLDSHLKDRGMRNSSPREKLLEFLCSHDNGLNSHFEADTVALMLEKMELGVSRASVFRNFNLFTEIGILRKSKFGENHFHYELAGGEKKLHHHLICRKCGKFIEFDKGSFKNIAKNIAGANGFDMIDYRFEVFGLCPECKKGK